MQIIHDFFKITLADLIIGCRLPFDDAVEHHHHGDGSRLGVIGIPLVV